MDVVAVSLCTAERFFCTAEKLFAPSLQQKTSHLRNISPVYLFSSLFVFAQRNADLIGIEGMGRREASKEGVLPGLPDALLAPV